MKLTAAQTTELLKVLETRFQKNVNRHKGLDWSYAEKRLGDNPSKLLSLYAMEKSGGEPDVLKFDKKKGEVVFCDFSPESPKDRRSLCYDEAALNSRKENKPKGSAVGMAESMGAELMDESEYRDLQKLGSFDTKTSSWIRTPDDIRQAGGALFCDRRYGHVFVYHNGAESYYAARGFRVILRV